MIEDRLRSALHTEVDRVDALGAIDRAVLKRARRRVALSSGALSLVVLAFIGATAWVAMQPRLESLPARQDQGAEWESLPTAPIEGRSGHVSVSTGTELIVWGGSDGSDDPAGLVDGAAFDYGSRSWRTLAGAPLQVSNGRSAVWTGAEMIVWGGEVGDGSHGRPDNGAAYDPSSDSWRELASSPYWSLASHSAIWTGTEVIVWGGVTESGSATASGAAYDPRSNSWRSLSEAPIAGRHRHAVVWTGTEMIVWGGVDVSGDPLADGAAYDPKNDSWRELSPAPLSERDSPAAVWTGSEMIVWGGMSEEGGRVDGAAYDPATDSWLEIPRSPVGGGFPALPIPIAWNGQQMAVVGAGGDVALYSPEDNNWTPLPDPPAGRVMAPSLVAEGDGVVLWGGADPSGGESSSEGAVLHFSDTPEEDGEDDEKARKEEIEPVRATVFLENGVKRADRRSFTNKLAEIDGIANFEFVSKREAFKRFKKKYQDQPEYWENLPKDALPAYFMVTLSDQADISRIVELLEGLRGVDEVLTETTEAGDL